MENIYRNFNIIKKKSKYLRKEILKFDIYEVLRVSFAGVIAKL
jgi:hypothetical protein